MPSMFNEHRGCNLLFENGGPQKTRRSLNISLHGDVGADLTEDRTPTPHCKFNVRNELKARYQLSANEIGRAHV